MAVHIQAKNTGDEIVILDDYSDNPKTIEILNEATKLPFVTLLHHRLNKNFGEHKTAGSRACKKDYIVQLDADECLHPTLLENLHDIVTINPEVELFRVPRVNIVRGITQNDVRRWGWRLSEEPNMWEIETVLDDRSEEYMFLKQNNLIISEEMVN